MSDRPGDALLELCESATSVLVLCAPFAKEGVVKRILEHTKPEIAVELITRWRPDEVAAGVSDTRVLQLLRERGGRVHLCDRLHAKFFRTESLALAGSANLTATALGWAPVPNIELLMPVALDAVADTERLIRRECVLATQGMADEVDAIAGLLGQQAPPPPADDASRQDVAEMWLPHLREPADLFIAYSAGGERLTRMSRVAATEDLEYLQIPRGLSLPMFERLVGHRLCMTPAVGMLDDFLHEPQRFGAVRDRLGVWANLPRDESDVAWQTLMRWLLEFLPGRYERRVFRRSEVFQKAGSWA